jgi:hypothetical protein
MAAQIATQRKVLPCLEPGPFLPFAFLLLTFIVAFFVDFAPIFSTGLGHNGGNTEQLRAT